MGFMLEDRGIAQVSMNMVNYEDTPLYLAYEMINSLAERYGTRVIESEIVGLLRLKVGTSRLGSLFSAAQLRGRNKLHRFSNLFCGTDAAYAALYVLHITCCQV